MDFRLNDFTAEIICENHCNDAKTETVLCGNTLDLFLTANESEPKFIKINWKFKSKDDIWVLGDAWERSYGDLEFKKLPENNRNMPWYFIASDKKESFCFGVKTQPNAFFNFTYTTDGITTLVDCRNGGCGVKLNGRKIHLGTFVFKKYDSANIFACLCDYCKLLCDSPVLPSEKIYGGNNWYYAYGKSSYGEIISDTKLLVKLAEGIENKPFEVIDDCWQIHSCEGPWVANEKFGDMQKLAAEIKETGARPGIWVRLLHNRDESLTEEMRILRSGKRKYLDPTHPAVAAYIKSDIERIKGWGYEMIKHDFTTADLFGHFGKDLDETITKTDGWHFYDRTKTNAEITLDLYKLIKEACGDMLIIGCNTVSHLCAGLVQINRIGDDTSGREWERTKKMGVNTLAFRLAQNEAFYMCDADCVGILDDYIPWEKNKQWLHVLSLSNTPLFVSCKDCLTDEQKADLAKAFKEFQKDHQTEPVDIFETKTPSKWLVDGTVYEYQW